MDVEESLPVRRASSSLEGFAALHDGRTAEGYDLLHAGVRSLAAMPDWFVSGMAGLIPWMYAAALLFGLCRAKTPHRR